MNDYIIYPKQLGRQPIPVERNHCFFLMPFSKEFDMIYGTIKQYLNNENFICNRADEISGSTPIVAKILTNIIGIGRNAAYSIVKKGYFSTVRIGGTIRISKRSFDAWLDEENKPCQVCDDT